MDEFTGTEILGGETGTATGAGVLSALPREGEMVAGRYKVVSLLGCGGSSAVYKCQDMELKRDVALKLLTKASAEAEARLRREAAVGTRWEHPNLLRLYDFGTWNGTPFITMPVAAGGTMADRIRGKGRLPFEEVLSISSQILEGLCFLHGEGFIHRDIKPSNIFFDSRGTARLGDFGIVLNSSDTRYTSDGFRVGTPQYMSPEYMSGQPLTLASDLWSLGVSLREALAGNQDAPLPGEVPKWFAKWLSGLLQTDPSKRFRDAGNALTALQQRNLPPHMKKKRLIFAAALLAAGAAIYGAVLAGSYFFPKDADSIMALGNIVKGYSGKGKLAWSRAFQGKVAVTSDFDKSPGAISRFIVLYGGSFDVFATQRLTPHAAILSSTGEIITDVDLLKVFNPFKGKFSEDLYSAEILKIYDLDSDGHPEAWVNCKHNMYPDILYFFSAEQKKCTGAFANSGHIYDVACGGSPRGFTKNKAAYLVAINNKMGHQYVLTHYNRLNAFCLSPDQDTDSGILLHFPYRPISIKSHKTIDSIYVNDDNQLVVNTGGSEPLIMDQSGRLSTDSWISASEQPVNMSILFESFYLSLARIRKELRNGSIERGVHEALELIGSTKDPSFKLYAQLDSVQALLDAGFPDKAILVLPENPESCPHPETAYLKKGEVLILNGMYDKAKSCLLRARDSRSLNMWYGLPGVITCELMKGAGASGIYETIMADYPNFLANSSCSAWMLQAGMLRGETKQALEKVRSEAPQLYSRTNNYDEKVLFPFIGEIWQAFAAVDAGEKQIVLPDEGEVEKCGDKERLRELRLLKAYKMFKETGSLKALKAAREELSRAYRRESSALVPFVLSSYFYGSALLKSGSVSEGRDVLKTATGLYPFGERAREALSAMKGTR